MHIDNEKTQNSSLNNDYMEGYLFSNPDNESNICREIIRVKKETNEDGSYILKTVAGNVFKENVIEILNGYPVYFTFNEDERFFLKELVEHKSKLIRIKQNEISVLADAIFKIVERI
jgi:hypothetical protein